jgi:hypothetical protein
MKKIIRLTESDLHRIVKKSVNRILREMDEPYNEHEYSDEDFDEYGNRVDGPDFGEDMDDNFWYRFERQHGY